MVLSASLIRDLAARQGDPFVTSFYLDVDGRLHPRPSDVEPRVEALFRAARARADDLGEDARAAVEGDLAAIGAWLDGGIDRSRTRGVAAFSCAAAGFFATLDLPVRVADRVGIDRRPQVAPLLAALEASRPCLVALADRERGRLLQVSGGQVRELGGPFDEVERQVDTDVELGSFERRHEEALRRHLRAVAAAVTGALRDAPDTVLLVGGPAATELGGELGADKAVRIAGYLEVAITRPADEVAAMAEALLAELGHRHDVDLYDELSERAGVDASLGMAPTLDALAAHRVATLVVARGLEAGGGRCRSCGALAAAGTVACAHCGGTLDDVPDLVEAAIGDALGEGASVELVEVAAFAAQDGIGAIERY